MAAEQNIDAERATPELKPCPICGGPAHSMLEDRPEAWWVGCEKNGCVSTDTHMDIDDAIAVWNRRSAAIGEGETCPVCEKGKLIPLHTHFCDTCGIECATDADATENVAAKRRVEVSLQAAQGVKTWQERYESSEGEGGYEDMMRCMEAEIADLRAQLTSTGQNLLVTLRELDTDDKTIADLRAQLASQSQGVRTLPEDLLDELNDAVIEAFNQAFAIKDWGARDHWRDVLTRFEDWRAAPPLYSEQQARPKRTPLESFAIRMSCLDPHPDVTARELVESIHADANAVLAAGEQQTEKGDPNVG